jgi:hypothetical protein|tara:strand:+ start:1734 stop:1880 length:147 start_codon:yes stop_codon:yes gene_type:complete
MDIIPIMNKHITLKERRIYFLSLAEKKAKNPEWKALWKSKKEELLKNL